MDLALDSLAFGLAIGFMVLGMIGIIVPLIPGMLLIWLTVAFYAGLTGDIAYLSPVFIVITLVAAVAGTADFWLPLLGARTTGASWRALLLGVIGAILGLFWIPIPVLGSIIGYALGVLLGQYWKLRDWELAVKASIGGLAGWGIATAIQLGAGLLIIILFVWQVMA